MPQSSWRSRSRNAGSTGSGPSPASRNSANSAGSKSKGSPPRASRDGAPPCMPSAPDRVRRRRGTRRRAPRVVSGFTGTSEGGHTGCERFAATRRVLAWSLPRATPARARGGETSSRAGIEHPEASGPTFGRKRVAPRQAGDPRGGLDPTSRWTTRHVRGRERGWNAPNPPGPTARIGARVRTLSALTTRGRTRGRGRLRPARGASDTGWP